MKEDYFATLLLSIAKGLLKDYDLPPYHDFLRQIDGNVEKTDDRTGAEIVEDLKQKLLRRRKEKEK